MTSGKEIQDTNDNGPNRRDPLVVTFNLNGSDTQVIIEPHWTLVFVLREKLGLMGTKEACGEGACGACTVLVNGVPTLSCMTLAATVAGKKIETIEGLAQGPGLHPIQEAFVEEHGVQCGYCTSGFIMTTRHLLEHNPLPSEAEIKQGLAGNICRCGGYEHIVNSVKRAAEKLSKGSSQDE